MTISVAFSSCPPGGRIMATSGNTGTTLQYDHVFGPNDTALVVSVTGIGSGLHYWWTATPNTYADWGRSVYVGNVPLTLLEVHDVWPGVTDGWQSTWGLVGPQISQFAGTTQTISCNEVYQADGSLYRPCLHGTSVSYSGAGSLTHAGYTGSGSTTTISIPSGPGHMVYSAFTGSRWGTPASGTERYYYTSVVAAGGGGASTDNSYDGLWIQDQPGASGSVSASIASPDYGQIVAVAVDLAPLTGPPPVIATTVLNPMTVNVPFSQTLTASGTAPITWSLQAGSLPPGLTLTAAGVISGIPTQANPYDFTLNASNIFGPSLQEYTGAVVPIPFDPKGIVNVKYLLGGFQYPIPARVRTAGAFGQAPTRE